MTPRSVTTAGDYPSCVPCKVLARILLDGVREKLPTHQRHKHSSGFSPEKSTVCRILAFRLLTERLCDFRTLPVCSLCGSPQGVRLCGSRCTLENPASRGIPPKLLITGLHYGTESALKCDGIISDYFFVDTGVRQKCVLALTLFNTCMYYVLGRMPENVRLRPVVRISPDN